MTGKEIRTERKRAVVTSNYLTRNQIVLSARERKIVTYLISRIKPGDDLNTRYSFKIRDFCEVCGIDYFHNMADIKDVIRSIADKSEWVRTTDQINGKKVKAERLFRWMESVEFVPDTGIVRFNFPRNMGEQLFELRKNFTEYQLISILGMKNKYSIHFYQYLRSFKSQGQVEMPLEELREVLQLGDKYQNYKDLSKFVLKPAIREINLFSDIEVEMQKMSDTGRTVSSLLFLIKDNEENLESDYATVNYTLDRRLPSLRTQGKEVTKHLAEISSMQEYADILSQGSD